VFVADNNSVDGSPEMVEARFPQVSLTRYSQNVGYAKSINPMLPLGKGKYYLLLHSDLEILPNTLKQFVGFFEAYPQAGILGGNLYYPDGTPNPREVLFPSFKNELLCFAWRLFKKLPIGSQLFGNYDPAKSSRKSTSQVNWVWNACMMVRKEVLDKVGYFDEDFFVWYADWDLCKRAADAGWSVHYLHPAIAIHHERQSFAKEEIVSEEVRYKVDGWYSAPKQIKDRHTFLKKHSSSASIYGVKAICVVTDSLRLCLILGNLVLRKVTFREASFQLRACLQTIQTILKA
jgi:GT2 family glycosyltransferase